MWHLNAAVQYVWVVRWGGVVGFFFPFAVSLCVLLFHCTCWYLGWWKVATSATYREDQKGISHFQSAVGDDEEKKTTAGTVVLV